MPIIKFESTKPIYPLFGIKIPPVLHNLCEYYEDDEELEEVMKVALNIEFDREIRVKTVEDNMGNMGTIVIVYREKEGKRRAEAVIPEKEGFFDFNIYDMDFNAPIDVEKIIEKKK